MSRTLAPDQTGPPRTGALERLLRPEEAAAILGVQPRTITTWARRGEVPHVVLQRARDGRAQIVRFEEAAIRAWIAKRRAGAEPQPSSRS